MHGPAEMTGTADGSAVEGRPTEAAQPARALRPQRVLAGDQHPVGRDRDQPPPDPDDRLRLQRQGGLQRVDADPARPLGRQGNRRGDHRQPRGPDRDPRPADDCRDQRPHDEPAGQEEAVHHRRDRARHALPGRPVPRRRLDRRPCLLLPAPVQLELRPGPVPGLHARPCAGEAGRPREWAHGPDDPARGRRRSDPRGRGDHARRRPLRDLRDHGRRAAHDAARRSSAFATGGRAFRGRAGRGSPWAAPPGAPTSSGSAATSGC